MIVVFKYIMLITEVCVTLLNKSTDNSGNRDWHQISRFYVWSSVDVAFVNTLFS